MFLNISKGFELCGEWKQPTHEVYIHGHRVDVFTARRSEIKYDRVRAKKIMRQREPSQVAERETNVSVSCLWISSHPARALPPG